MASYAPLGWVQAPKTGWPRYAAAGGVVALVLLALHGAVAHLNSGLVAPLGGYDTEISRRIQDDLQMTSEQCLGIFPKLYHEADRAAKYWKRKGGVTLDEVDAAEEDGSNARIAIIDNRLYVKSYNGNAPNSRTRASLAAIHQAILTSPEPLPDLDLVIMSADGGGGVGPRFVLDRREEDEHMWLLPDFGFYAWPEPLGSGSGAYHQVRRNTLEREVQLSEKGGEVALVDTGNSVTEPASWSAKIPKLLWRGVPMVEVRQDLLRASENQPWADVHDLDWGNVGENSPYKTPAEHCDYAFLAHVEGWAYSGRLKYLQNCRSVIVTHPLEWIQHYHHLFDASSSSSQNIVVVPTPLTEHLPREMERLLADPVRAERIASESWRVFREGYLSPAANECYLRHVLRAYASVQTFQPSISPETAAYEGFVLTGEAHWGRH